MATTADFERVAFGDAVRRWIDNRTFKNMYHGRSGDMSRNMDKYLVAKYPNTEDYLYAQKNIGRYNLIDAFLRIEDDPAGFLADNRRFDAMLKEMEENDA